MANIFLSYASKDRLSAKALAQILEQSSHSVFWDRTIQPGQSFDEVIEAALTRAEVVVVLWSRAAVASDWVRAEATDGAARKILIPAKLEEVEPPLRFRMIQAADLTEWDPNRPSEVASTLVTAIQNFVSGGNHGATLPTVSVNPTRSYSDLSGSPGTWEDVQKKFWTELQAAAAAGARALVKTLILSATRERIPRYAAIGIIVPVWEKFFLDPEELFAAVSAALNSGPSAGLLRVLAEAWPDRVAAAHLSRENVASFVNYDGAQSVKILYSLLLDPQKQRYVDTVRALLAEPGKLFHLDHVVEFLREVKAIDIDGAIRALSNRGMNWPDQHCYVALVRQSKLSHERLRELASGVLRRNLTSITEPLLDELHFDPAAASRIICASIVARPHDSDERYALALARCTPADLKRVEESREANSRNMR